MSCSMTEKCSWRLAGEDSIAFSRECSCVVQVFGGFVDECRKAGVDVPLQSQVLSKAVDILV